MVEYSELTWWAPPIRRSSPRLPDLQSKQKPCYMQVLFWSKLTRTGPNQQGCAKVFNHFFIVFLFWRMQTLLHMWTSEAGSYLPLCLQVGSGSALKQTGTQNEMIPNTSGTDDGFRLNITEFPPLISSNEGPWGTVDPDQAVCTRNMFKNPDSLMSPLSLILNRELHAVCRLLHEQITSRKYCANVSIGPKEASLKLVMESLSGSVSKLWWQQQSRSGYFCHGAQNSCVQCLFFS